MSYCKDCVVWFYHKTNSIRSKSKSSTSATVYLGSRRINDHLKIKIETENSGNATYVHEETFRKKKQKRKVAIDEIDVHETISHKQR